MKVENCTFVIVKEAKINFFVGGNICANPTKQNKTKQKQGPGQQSKTIKRRIQLEPGSCHELNKQLDPTLLPHILLHTSGLVKSGRHIVVIVPRLDQMIKII